MSYIIDHTISNFFIIHKVVTILANLSVLGQTAPEVLQEKGLF
jgi:phage-related holin